MENIQIVGFCFLTPKGVRPAFCSPITGALSYLHLSGAGRLEKPTKEMFLMTIGQAEEYLAEKEKDE